MPGETSGRAASELLSRRIAAVVLDDTDSVLVVLEGGIFVKDANDGFYGTRSWRASSRSTTTKRSWRGSLTTGAASHSRRGRSTPPNLALQRTPHRRGDHRAIIVYSAVRVR